MKENSLVNGKNAVNFLPNSILIKKYLQWSLQWRSSSTALKLLSSQQILSHWQCYWCFSLLRGTIKLQIKSQSLKKTKVNLVCFNLQWEQHNVIEKKNTLRTFSLIACRKMNLYSLSIKYLSPNFSFLIALAGYNNL